MAVRASDRVTLAVLPSPSYVRLYYLLQASNLAAPVKPTTNPPASPWTTTEPNYTAGSTQTLYTVMVTAYGSVAFEYGDVQKSSAYEAAKQAHNLADTARIAAALATTTANGKNTRLGALTPPPATNPDGAIGDLWEQWNNAGNLKGTWRWEGSPPAWVNKGLDPTYIPVIDIGTGTAGQFDAERLTAGSVKADKLDAEQIWGSEAWLDVLRAGVIEVDFLEPNFGENLNLSANGQIVLMAGRQDEQASETSAAQVRSDDAYDLASDADAAAGQAQAAAGSAATQAGSARAVAEAAKAKADSIGTRVVITSDGLELQSAQAEHVFKIEPTGAAIMHGGIPVSTWTGSQFSSEEVVARESAQIVNHKAVKNGTRTTWRVV